VRSNVAIAFLMRVTDCCLTPIQAIYFYWDDDEVCIFLDKHAELDLHSAS
jgi:hypothetical protein